MWPFTRTKKARPNIGPCPICAHTIDYGRTACRNQVFTLPTCKYCTYELDLSESPAFAFVHVQQDRRRRKACRAKEILRRSQLATPLYVRSRYWIVYSIGRINICYDTLLRTYDVKAPNEADVLGLDTDGLFAWVSDSAVLNMTDSK